MGNTFQGLIVPIAAGALCAVLSACGKPPIVSAPVSGAKDAAPTEIAVQTESAVPVSAESVDTLLAAALLADFPVLEQLASEAEASGTLESLLEEMERRADLTNSPPAVHVALSVLYGRKGLRTREYAALAAAEEAAKRPGVVFNIGLVYGRKQLLAGAPDAESFMTGTLDIGSEPAGASVSVDGKPAGTTPLVLEQVKAGKHSIAVNLSGYEKLVLETEIGVGRTHALMPSLRPLASGFPSVPGQLARFIEGNRLKKTFETNFRDPAFEKGIMSKNAPLTRTGSEVWFAGSDDFPQLVRTPALRPGLLAVYTLQPAVDATFTFELIRLDGDSFESLTIGGNADRQYAYRKQLSKNGMDPLPWACVEFSYRPGTLMTFVVETLENGYVTAGFYDGTGAKNLVRLPFSLDGGPWHINMKAGPGRIRLVSYLEFEGTATASLAAATGPVYPVRDPPVKNEYTGDWERVWQGPANTTIHGITFLNGDMWWNFYQAKTINRVDQTGTVLQAIPHYGNKLTGITNDGTRLWITSEDNRIYILDTAFDKQKSFDSPGQDSTAVYWHRGSIWHTGFTGEAVRMDLDGKVLQRIKTPVNNNEGLVVGENRLFVADYDNAKINVLDWTGRLVTMIPLPLQRPIALAWDGEYLYLTGDNQPQIWRLRL